MEIIIKDYDNYLLYNNFAEKLQKYNETVERQNGKPFKSEEEKDIFANGLGIVKPLPLSKEEFYLSTSVRPISRKDDYGRNDLQHNDKYLPMTPTNAYYLPFDKDLAKTLLKRCYCTILRQRNRNLTDVSFSEDKERIFDEVAQLYYPEKG